jgi:hypothetical protein
MASRRNDGQTKLGKHDPPKPKKVDEVGGPPFHGNKEHSKWADYKGSIGPLNIAKSRVNSYLLNPFPR